MFCPQCGETEEELVDGICKSCFLEELILAQLPDELEITVCAHCNSRLESVKWQDLELSDEEIILNTLQKHIKLNERAQSPKINVETLFERGSVIECMVHVEAEVLGQIVHQEYSLKFKIIRTVCPECSKIASGYYEAVIQLRAQDRVLDNEEIGTADALIGENIDKISRKNKMAYISERAVLKEGIDYYVGSSKVAKRLVGTLKDHLGGNVKESPRLTGRDKSAGKDLYRTWISLRIPYFRLHDIIRYRNHMGPVMAMDGKRVQFEDFDTGNLISVQWRKHGKIETIARREDITKTTLTAKTPNSIQILHPDTYEPIDIEINPESVDMRIGSEVPVVILDGKVFLLKNFQNI